MIPPKDLRFLPKLEQFLIKVGSIYTVRRFLYHKGCDLVSVNNSGTYRRKFIQEVTSIKDLEPYSHLSGLYTPEKWWSKLTQINHGLKPSEDRPFYLYGITPVEPKS